VERRALHLVAAGSNALGDPGIMLWMAAGEPRGRSAR
jgi:hypothetical protein